MRQFAERKGWPIGEIDLTLTYDRIDGEGVIRKEIAFSGHITDEQRKVLLRVAHCGMEKMLERGMKFITSIA